MDCFKLETGIAPVFPISNEDFLRESKRKPPYVNQNADGKPSFYAVCPACDNPIQIIGLFKNTAEATRKPHGKHIPRSIINLANYWEDDYYNCPYSNPKYKKTNAKRSSTSPIAQSILTLLKEQFDRVIYVLSKDMQIYISHRMARRLLQEYLTDEGFLYRNASLYNLPWFLMHANRPVKLFGQWIAKDSALHHAISSQCTDVVFLETEYDRYLKIHNKTGSYITLQYFFYGHKQDVVNDSLEESIIFEVFTGTHPHIKTIYTKKINLSIDYFLNLIHIPEEKATRNQQYLEIASQLIS